MRELQVKNWVACIPDSTTESARTVTTGKKLVSWAPASSEYHTFISRETVLCWYYVNSYRENGREPPIIIATFNASRFHSLQESEHT